MKKIIIIVIALIVLVGIGAYLLGKNKNEKISETIVPETTTMERQVNLDTPEIAVASSSEDSTTEIFRNQPGAIKTIINQKDNEWLLTIDLLTRNPNWRPGEEIDFFVNQNAKVRNLLVTEETKTYECNNAKADTLRNTSNFMSDIQNNMMKREREAEKFGTRTLDYTSYFDISGSKITAIYQQCLP